MFVSCPESNLSLGIDKSKIRESKFINTVANYIFRLFFKIVFFKFRSDIYQDDLYIFKCPHCKILSHVIPPIHI